MLPDKTTGFEKNISLTRFFLSLIRKNRNPSPVFIFILLFLPIILPISISILFDCKVYSVEQLITRIFETKYSNFSQGTQGEKVPLNPYPRCLLPNLYALPGFLFSESPYPVLL